MAPVTLFVNRKRRLEAAFIYLFCRAGDDREEVRQLRVVCAIYHSSVVLKEPKKVNMPVRKVRDCEIGACPVV